MSKGALPAATLLTHPPSYDTPSDALPARAPTVTTAPTLPPDPIPALHVTAVSPDHTLACAPDPPTRPRTVQLRPSPVAPVPNTTSQLVSCAPSPLAAPPATAAPPPASMLTAPLTLPCAPLAVTLAPRLPPPPCPSRHRADVSDVHTLDSHPDAPTRPRTVPSLPPRPCPATAVVGVPPTPPHPPLVPDAALTATPSLLHASVVEPTTAPIVAASTPLHPPPWLA